MAVISFSNLIISKNTFALYTPTLSASLDNSVISVNGNQVINSVNGTTELPLMVTVNTNNKTGYTAILNTETNETALVNSNSASGAKIDSISTNSTLNNLPNNTWGFRFGLNTNFSPIPALSTPAQIIQTTGKTNGNESNQLSIGMKLSENLESGNYTNKLVISIISNPYERRAVMERGVEFSGSIDRMGLNDSFEDAWGKKEKIKHVYASSVAPELVPANAKNVEDRDESDYEIKLWLDPTDKTAYYYSEPERVYLNEDMNSMFRNMSSLTSLNLSNFDTSKVTNMSYMFFNTSSFTLLNLSNFDTSQVMNMDSIFRGMTNLTTIDLSNFDTSSVTDMSSMFADMHNLTTLNLSNFNTSKVKYMNRMFSDMHNLTALNLSNFDTSKVTDMHDMFSNVRNLTTLNLSNFNTSRVTDMGFMFYHMSSLISLNLSNFNTSNVTDMSSMFAEAHKLKTLNLGRMNTSRVTTMEKMFDNMWALENLDVSSFDTSNVTNMAHMFGGLAKITTLNLNNFNTSKVTDMSDMFNSMLVIENLSLPSFDTRSVTNMAGMFAAMEGLRNLNISSFDTRSVKNFRYMFMLGIARDYGHDQVDHLEHIYASKKFVISAMETGGSESIFYRRPSLTVGAGCTYVSGTGNPFCIGSTWVVVP